MSEDKKFKRNNIIEFLESITMDRLHHVFEKEAMLLDTEKDREVFFKIMSMECQVAIFATAKDLIEQKNQVKNNIFTMEDLINAKEKVANNVFEKIRLFPLLNDNDEVEPNKNSFNYIKDFVFLKKEEFTNFTEKLKEEKYIADEELDDIFELFRKRDSWEIISKNREMLESINQEAIIKRSERVFSNKIIKNVLKDFILNESVVDKDVFKQISSTSTNYYRKVTIPVDIKMELVEKLVDMKIDNKTKIENLERVLDLGDNESFIVSEKELNKLVKTYYSYKEHGGIRYLLAHLVLRKNIRSMFHIC